MQHPVFAGLLALTLTGLAALPARAATVYSDRSAFLAAITSPTLIDFNNNVPFNPVSHGTSWTIGEATFGADTDLENVGPDFGGLDSGADFASDYLLWENNAGDEILTVTFANPVTALGFDFMEVRANVVPFTFTGAGLTTVVDSGPGVSFFGLVSATPFDSFTAVISHGTVNAFPSLDNFTYATNLVAGGGVPEPAIWALLIAGFAGAGAALRRRRATRSRPSAG